MIGQTRDIRFELAVDNKEAEDQVFNLLDWGMSQDLKVQRAVIESAERIVLRFSYYLRNIEERECVSEISCRTQEFLSSVDAGSLIETQKQFLGFVQ